MDLHAFNSLHHLQTGQKTEHARRQDGMEALASARAGHGERLKAYAAFNAELIPSSSTARRGDFVQPVDDQSFELLLTPDEHAEWQEYNQNLKVAAWEARQGRGPALEHVQQAGSTLDPGGDPLKAMIAGLCKSREFSRKLAEVAENEAARQKGEAGLDDLSEVPQSGILQDVRAKAAAKAGRRSLMATDSGINIHTIRTDRSPTRTNILVVDSSAAGGAADAPAQPLSPVRLKRLSRSYLTDSPGAVHDAAQISDSAQRRAVQFQGQGCVPDDLLVNSLFVDKMCAAVLAEDIPPRLSMNGAMGMTARFGRRSHCVLGDTQSFKRTSLTGDAPSPSRLERPTHRASHTGVLPDGQQPGWPSAAGDAASSLSGMMANAKSEFRRLLKQGESMVHDSHRPSLLSHVTASAPRGSLPGNWDTASGRRNSMSGGHFTVGDAPAKASILGLSECKSSGSLPAIRGSLSGTVADGSPTRGPAAAGSLSSHTAPPLRGSLSGVQMSSRAPARGSLNGLSTGLSTGLSKSSKHLTTHRDL